MTVHYSLEIERNEFTTINLSAFSFVTNIIKDKDKYFFNVQIGNGRPVSSMDIDKEVLELRKKKMLKAHSKFVKKYYKKTSTMVAKKFKKGLK